MLSEPGFKQVRFSGSNPCSVSALADSELQCYLFLLNEFYCIYFLSPMSLHLLHTKPSNEFNCSLLFIINDFFSVYWKRCVLMNRHQSRLFSFAIFAIFIIFLTQSINYLSPIDFAFWTDVKRLDVALEMIRQQRSLQFNCIEYVHISAQGTQKPSISRLG